MIFPLATMWENSNLCQSRFKDSVKYSLLLLYYFYITEGGLFVISGGGGGNVSTLFKAE